MLKNLKISKRLKTASKHWAILFASILILGLPSVSFCEDVSLTMPITDAKKIVTELDKTNLYIQQVDLLEKANAQLIEQNKILIEQISLLKTTVDLQKEQIDLQTQQLADQKKIYEDKIKVYEKSKGSFMDKVMIGLGGIGVGAVVGLTLALLL